MASASAPRPPVMSARLPSRRNCAAVKPGFQSAMIVSGKQIDLISDEDDAPTAHALGLGGRRLPFGRGEGGVERRLIGKGQHGMAVPARRFRLVIILRHRAMSDRKSVG